MAYNFKKLGDVESLSELSGEANVVTLVNGAVKQISKDKIVPVGVVTEDRMTAELEKVKSEIPRPDLSQNDETAVDYIKGRTHYMTKRLSEPILDTTYETVGTKYDGYYWGQSDWYPSGPETTYRITFDGVVYDDVNGAQPVGNLNIMNSSNEDNGMPFVTSEGSMGTVYIVSRTEGTHTIKVEEWITEYIKLDSNYLPDNVVLNGSGATETYAIALGGAETASGYASFAEGEYTVASGDYGSHAEGYETTASGQYGSHAEGRKTTAKGMKGSHAEGYGTLASSASQHVQGKYNVEDSASTYAHIVGNGTSSSARSNAHTLDWSGNAWYAGTVEGTGVILKSSTADSTKRFLVTVDDSGTLTATEITE